MKKFLLLQACEFTKYDQYEYAEDSNDELYSINENENWAHKWRIWENMSPKRKHYQNINNQLNASIDKLMESERKLKQSLQESQEKIIKRNGLIEEYKASKRKLKDENEQLKDFLNISKRKIKDYEVQLLAYNQK